MIDVPLIPLDQVPHLIIPAGSKSLKCVFDALGDAAGIWGDYPLVDELGGHNTWGRGLIEEFRLWGLPANEPELLRKGGYCRLGQFSFVIPQSVPEITLRLLDQSQQEYDAIYLENLWPLLMYSLPDIGWFFAPLDEAPVLGEVPVAIFCSANIKCRDAVKVKISECNIDSEIAFSRDSIIKFYLEDEIKDILFCTRGTDL